jgi:hypothetical protein
MLKYIEQLEMNSCSISFIKNSIFDKYSSAFRHLKYLTLASNNLNKIIDLTFNGLTNLILLDLDDNPIEYIQSNAFLGLRKLKYLSLNTNHAKLFNLNPNPVWFFNILKLNKQIQEISFRTSKLLKYTCLLTSILTTVNNLNQDIALKNSSAKLVTASISGRRAIKLFTQEQIDYAFHSLHYLNEVYCNVYMACKITKNFSHISHLNVWQIELFKSCPLIISDSIYDRCLIDRRVKDCQKNSSSATAG